MQETKMKNEVFPTSVFSELGYESAHFGQGQWNGVAIISRVGLENVIPNFKLYKHTQNNYTFFSN